MRRHHRCRANQKRSGNRPCAPQINFERHLLRFLNRGASYSERDEGADVVELAAKYTAGIVQNHPFVDGNKRTGFVVGILFLELNGYRFKASEEAAAQAILELAAGTMDEKAFCEFVRANSKRTRT